MTIESENRSGPPAGHPVVPGSSSERRDESNADVGSDTGLSPTAAAAGSDDDGGDDDDDAGSVDEIQVLKNEAAKAFRSRDKAKQRARELEARADTLQADLLAAHESIERLSKINERLTSSVRDYRRAKSRDTIAAYVDAAHSALVGTILEHSERDSATDGEGLHAWLKKNYASLARARVRGIDDRTATKLITGDRHNQGNGSPI